MKGKDLKTVEENKMTEEKQKEIPSLESIVGEMGKIAALSNIYNQYDYAEKPSEKGELLRVAATVLSNARDGAEFNATYNQLEGEGFSDKLKYSRDRRVEQIGEAYEARRNEILSRIVDKLNKDLKDAKNLREATQKIGYAFAPLISRMTQEDADKEMTEYLEDKAMIPVTKPVHADRNSLYGLRVARFISEFITESGEGEEKSYSIDREKIAKLVENPVIGSTLYSAEKPKERAQQYEQQN